MTELSPANLRSLQKRAVYEFSSWPDYPALTYPAFSEAECHSGAVFLSDGLASPLPRVLFPVGAGNVVAFLESAGADVNVELGRRQTSRSAPLLLARLIETVVKPVLWDNNPLWIKNR